MTTKTPTQFLELAKTAKKSKNYNLEKEILEKANNMFPNNLKILNALFRNLRKTGTLEEKKKILENIYDLNPNGKVLQNLILIAKDENNKKRELFLLKEKQKIESNNKKNMKRINSLNNDLQQKQTPIINQENQYDLVLEARKIIYKKLPLSEKKQKIYTLLESQSSEIIFAITSELYQYESLTEMARKLIKHYKSENLNDMQKIKLANTIYQLVTCKKTNEINWNDFWLENQSNIVNNESNTKHYKK